MGDNTFVVPQNFNGMSLKDIFGQVGSNGGYVPDIGTLSSLTGLSPDSKLSTGQSVTFNKNDPGSGEYKFLSSNFTPQSTANSNAISDYITRLGTTTTANQNKAYSDFNVAPLQDAASQIQQRLNLLKTNANNVGAGGYASQNQVNGAASNLSTRGAIASNAASSAANAAQNEFQNLQQPVTTEGNLLTANQKNQLDLTIAKINSGAQLTQQEMQDANNLAQLEAKMTDANKQPTQLTTFSQGGITYSFNPVTGETKQVASGGGPAPAPTPTLNSNNTSTNTNSAGVQSKVTPPPMSSPAGTVQENPPGSGIYWTSTGNGWE